ncbi:MAG: hypothetical protein GX804_11680 [Lentisphaerae bacterium]|nr:hypothetical protein [Lentisphaerota bacterium]
MRAAVVFVILLMMAFANAATITWQNNTEDGLWGTPENWSGGLVPTEVDTAVLPYIEDSDGRVTLDSDFEVSSFQLQGLGTILDGLNTYKLILKGRGMVGGNVKTEGTVLADLLLMNDGELTSPSNWDSRIDVFGDVTDNGDGYNITFGGSHNNKTSIGGLIDVGGELYVQSLDVKLGDRFVDEDETVYEGGAITNAAGVYMDCRFAYADQHNSQFIIDNSVVADNDRIRGDVKLGTVRNGGRFTLKGNSETNVVERVKAFDIRSGVMVLDIAGENAANKTDLVFEGYERANGTSATLTYSKSGRLIIENAQNHNGIWVPWMLHGGHYVKVDDSGAIVQTVNADYETPASTGNDASEIYRFADTDLELTENTEVYGLLWDRSSAQTLNLGENDLTIGCGTLLITGNGDKTITSSGGSLVFGGEDIILFVNGNGKAEIGVPIAWNKPSGSTVEYPSVVFPNVAKNDGVHFTGKDLIGDYGSFHAYTYDNNSLRSLYFGGPSDRRFHGDITGVMAIEKTGTGTLELYGESLARKVSLFIREGIVKIGNINAPRPEVYEGGACEVLEGIAIPSTRTPTMKPGGMIMGDGTVRSNFTLDDDVKLSGGSAGKVGTLTLCVDNGAKLTLKDGNTLSVKIDAGEKNAAVNSLVKVGQKIVFPKDTPITFKVDVTDLSEGTALVKDKVFTVMEWDSLDNFDEELVTFEITTSEPWRVGISNATVDFDTVAKKMMLSGIELSGRGSAIIVR